MGRYTPAAVVNWKIPLFRFSIPLFLFGICRMAAEDSLLSTILGGKLKGFVSRRINKQQKFPFIYTIKDTKNFYSSSFWESW
jgi:hypothetical protein